MKKTDDYHEFNPGKYISMLYRHGRCYMDTAMSKFEIGSGQYTFLFYLYKDNGASQDEISKALDIDKATTARAITKLEDKGFITRETDESDRRVNRIYLTEKSIEIKEEMINFSKQWSEIILEGISETEKENLRSLLYKISENASKYKKNRCRKGEKND